MGLFEVKTTVCAHNQLLIIFFREMKLNNLLSSRRIMINIRKLRSYFLIHRQSNGIAEVVQIHVCLLTKIIH